ncbi:MAG: dethiobiotin synthase [Pontiellaceae bacterium]|nr:dethiobiotin synthase [Pontiellaceae bacterium]
MNGLFITGTDTDIGKTALSALLLAELRRRNINAAPMKPAQTGCAEKLKNGNWKPETGNLKTETKGEFQVSDFTSQVSNYSVPDLDYSLSMAQMKVDDATYATMAPYTFEPACSPHLAAEMAGTEIDIAEMVIAARTLARTYEFILAEGAGGILVPLNRRELMIDLMQALRFPVLLVARPNLGTINHTLLSIRTLRSDGLDIAGVVLVSSRPGEPGFIEADSAATIEQFGNVPVLGTISYCPQLAPPRPRFSDLPDSIKEEIRRVADQLIA